MHYDIMPLLRIVVVTALLAAVALADWPMYQQNPRHTGVASDTSINASNVSRLSEDWTFVTGDWVTGTPIVVNGTAYVGSWDGNFYALRESDGQRLWDIAVGRTKDNCGATYGVDSTAAYSAGIVYVGAANCDLYALDAATGRQIFKTHLADSDQGFHLWSSPVVFEGKVYVGLASHCDHPCVRGRIVCLSATNGGVLWSFYTSPEGSAGAGTWSSMAIDETRRLVFAATGNFCTGDDTYGDSIVALNADSGSLVWVYKNINRDSQNLDFGASPALFDVNGTPALAAGSKDGHCYAVDRVSGQLLWNTRVTDGSTVGGIISSPAAADGRVFMGASSAGNQSGKVVALDQRDGRILWEVAQTRPVIGAPAVADGVLFIGGADGGLRAYNPVNGDVLWRADMGPILGGVSIVQDRILAGSIDHKVHAFKLNLSQNQPPRASIRASVTSGRPPLTVDFSATASDPDGSVVSYAWDFGDGATSSLQAPSHTYQTSGNFTARLRVVDNGGATAGDSIVIGVGDGGGAAAQNVVWKNVAGCAVSGNSLLKTAVSAWGNAGASSEQVIELGAGYVQFTASETNRERMFGLSNSDADQSYASIAFAIHLNTGRSFHVSESGTSRGYFGDYASGDVFRVAIDGRVVRYSRNGQVFYTSGFAPRYPLIVDAALNGEGATISNAVISIGSLGTAGPPTVQVLAPNGGEKLKSEGSASTYTIRWTATGSRLERYDVYLSADDGATWQEIALGIAAPSDTHAWTVPNLKAKRARVRVVVYTADGQSAEDMSDAGFVIKKSKN